MEKCHCITATARYRCPHFVYPNCWKNENEPYDHFEEKRVPKKLPIVNSNLQYRKAEDVPEEDLFKSACSDYADRLQQHYENYEKENKMHIKITCEEIALLLSFAKWLDKETIHGLLATPEYYVAAFMMYKAKNNQLFGIGSDGI